jgi:hypothetical protein
MLSIRKREGTSFLLLISSRDPSLQTMRLALLTAAALTTMLLQGASSAAIHGHSIVMPAAVNSDSAPAAFLVRRGIICSKMKPQQGDEGLATSKDPAAAREERAAYEASLKHGRRYQREPARPPRDETRANYEASLRVGRRFENRPPTLSREHS